MNDETKLQKIKELLEESKNSTNFEASSNFGIFKKKLEDILEGKDDYTQQWLNGLQDSISSTHVNLELAAGYVFDEDEEDSARYKAYWDAARAIVEPQIEDEAASEAYFEFMESNDENWKGFIANSFGADWAKIAELVNENGY